MKSKVRPEHNLRWYNRHPYITGIISGVSAFAIALVVINPFANSDKSAETTASSGFEIVGEPNQDILLGRIAIPKSLQQEPDLSPEDSPAPKSGTGNKDNKKDSNSEHQQVTDIAPTPIVGIRFDDGLPGESILEQQNWIDPREVTPQKNSRGNISLEPKDWQETIDLVQAPLQDGKGGIINFSHQLGLDEDGRPIGVNQDGAIRDFKSAGVFHTLSTDRGWYPNEITQLDETHKAKVEYLTESGLVVTYELVDNVPLNKIGKVAVWEGFNEVAGEVDVVMAGCLIEETAENVYSPTQQVNVGRYEFAKAVLVQQ